MTAKIGMLVGLCVGLVGCMTPVPQFVPGPMPTTADYDAREQCLYDFICPAIQQRGTDPLTLETIGINATAACSGKLHEKIIYHYGGSLGGDLVDHDRAETEHHALVMAMSQVKTCAVVK